MKYLINSFDDHNLWYFRDLNFPWKVEIAVFSLLDLAINVSRDF